DEAIARSSRASELSPLDPHRYLFTSLAGTAHAVAGEYDKAIDLGQRSLRVNRMYMATHPLLAICLALSAPLQAAPPPAPELLALEPTLTVERFRQRYPGSAHAHTETFCEALAAAGVPR